MPAYRDCSENWTFSEWRCFEIPAITSSRKNEGAFSSGQRWKKRFRVVSRVEAWKMLVVSYLTTLVVVVVCEKKGLVFSKP
jgi:hypothetical protein